MDKDTLKKAATILVESGYAVNKVVDYDIVIVKYGIMKAPESVDPFYLGDDTYRECLSRRQLDAIFWYLIKGRDSSGLTGLGHQDHREQMIEHVKSELSK